MHRAQRYAPTVIDIGMYPSENLSDLRGVQMAPFVYIEGLMFSLEHSLFSDDGVML